MRLLRGVAPVGGRGDGPPGGEQVQARTPVGEVGAGVPAVGGADRDRRLDAGGRVAARGASVVARGHRVRDPGGDGVAYGRVELGVARAAEAHIGHGRFPRVRGDPVDTRDDLRGRPPARVVEHTYGDHLRLLGDAVRGARDDARDMGAVAVAVLCRAVVLHEVPAVARPSAEVLVGDPDPGVDHVHGDAPARRPRPAVAPVEGQVRLVDAVQAPRGRVGPAAVVGDLGVLDDRRHTGVGREPPGLPLTDSHGVAVQGGAVHMAYFRPVLRRYALSRRRRSPRSRFEGDDVTAVDGAGVTGAVDVPLRCGVRGQGDGRKNSGRHHRREPARPARTPDSRLCRLVHV